MAQGISEVLTYAVGVSISFLSIVAVILMLFSPRARVNGLAFLVGWVVALCVVSIVAYLVFKQADASTSASTVDTISWGRVGAGALLLVLAARDWLNGSAREAEPEMPTWMASVDAVSPGRAFGHGALMVGLSPKNLILTVAVSAALAELGLSRSKAAVSLIVFVIVASVTIAAPVVYYFVGGERAKAQLDLLRTGSRCTTPRWPWCCSSSSAST